MKEKKEEFRLVTVVLTILVKWRVLFYLTVSVEYHRLI